MASAPVVVFDLDGTLVDSARDLAAAARELVAGLGGRPPSVVDVVAMVGDGAAALVRRALEAGGLEPDTPGALECFLALYDRRLLDTTAPYPEMVRALEALPPGATLGVLTNKPLGPSRRILEGLGLARFFPHVIGGDGPFPRKPDPAGLRALAALAPGRPVILVGDSPVDAATAAAAPAAFAFAAYGFGAPLFGARPPSTPYVLSSPSDLPALIERFLRAAGAR